MNIPNDGQEIADDFDMQKAERAMEEVRKLQEMKEEILEHGKREILRIQNWVDREVEKKNNSQRFHRQNLITFLGRRGRKTIKLVNGVVKEAKGRQRIEILDEEAIDEKFMTTKTTKTPDKKLILQHIRECGEIPDGTDMIQGEKTYTVHAYTRKSEPEFFVTDEDKPKPEKRVELIEERIYNE